MTKENIFRKIGRNVLFGAALGTPAMPHAETLKPNEIPKDNAFPIEETTNFKKDLTEFANFDATKAQEEMQKVENEKPEEIDGPPMIEDDFDFEQTDTIPDNSVKYGYKFQGTRKMLAKTIEVGYYGSDYSKTLVRPPFRAEKSNTDIVYKLSSLYPQMGDKALFYNCAPDGSVHLVELPAYIEVFTKGGDVFAVICGNRLVLVKSEKKPVVKIREDEGQENTPEIEKELPPMEIVPKIAEEIVYKNGDKSVIFELYDRNTHQQIKRVGPIYLAKMINNKGQSFYKQISFEEWEDRTYNGLHGQDNLARLPYRNSGWQKVLEQSHFILPPNLGDDTERFLIENMINN